MYAPIFLKESEVIMYPSYDNGLAAYEREIDRLFEAQEHGFDSYEEYIESVMDDIGNRQYDEWKDDQMRAEERGQ